MSHSFEILILLSVETYDGITCFAVIIENHYQ
jgi:hypothetical protein